MFHWHLVPEMGNHPEFGIYDTYGISNGSAVVHDVSPDKNLVEGIVALLTDLQLSPSHLNDVIIDMIS